MPYLYNNLYQLGQEKRLPKLLLCSDDLGRVPIGALNVSGERSVSARLETLEGSVGKLASAVENISAILSSPRVPLPGTASGQVQSSQHTQSPNIPKIVVSPSPALPQPDWAHVAAGVQQVPNVHADVLGGCTSSFAGALQAGRGRDHPGQGQSQVVGQDKARDRVRPRSISPSTKRKASGEDEEGFRPQGRPRKTAGGASKVVLDDIGEYQPSQQFYVSNTPGHSTKDLIIKVLEKCSAPLLCGGSVLTVLDVECLTKEEEPRTKCWKVVVPFKFKDLMEKDELYPEGWRHRKFFGGRKISDQKKKQPRLEDPRLKEAEEELEKERIEVQKRQEDELKKLEDEKAASEMQVENKPTDNSDKNVGSVDLSQCNESSQ